MIPTIVSRSKNPNIPIKKLKYAIPLSTGVVNETMRAMTIIAI
jgi:hypothetical protein